MLLEQFGLHVGILDNKQTEVKLLATWGRQAQLLTSLLYPDGGFGAHKRLRLGVARITASAELETVPTNRQNIRSGPAFVWVVPAVCPVASLLRRFNGLPSQFNSDGT
jgi:hypothetical protein